MTVALARAAAQDAGNAAMRAAGRKAWSAADYNKAVRTMNRLLKLVPDNYQHDGSKIVKRKSNPGKLTKGRKVKARWIRRNTNGTITVAI